MKLTEAQQHITVMLAALVDPAICGEQTFNKVKSFLDGKNSEAGSKEKAFDYIGPNSTVEDSMLFVLNLLKGTTSEVHTQSPSPNKVEVIRYLRPVTVGGIEKNKRMGMSHSVSHSQAYSNLYGISVVYELDYITRVVKASWSVCNGDNFSKAEGVQRAKENNQKFAFSISDIDKYGDLTQAFIAAIDFKSGCEYNNYDFDALVRHLRKLGQAIKETTIEKSYPYYQ